LVDTVSFSDRVKADGRDCSNAAERRSARMTGQVEISTKHEG
jgi:hypothetical protein